MGDYASMKTWTNVEQSKDDTFRNYHRLLSEGRSYGEIQEMLGLNPEFGYIQFVTHQGETYATHIPGNLMLQEMSMKECKYDIPKEWLTCFGIGEFHIHEDGDFTVFTAHTTVEKAMLRLEDILQSNDSKRHRDALNLMSDIKRLNEFLVTKDPMEMLVVSSDMIYYNADGTFGTDKVRTEINRKVAEVTRQLTVPQWLQVTS